MTENWKSVPGYEGRYEVSDLGRVRSIAWFREVRNKWGSVNMRSTQGRSIKALVGHQGRFFVGLCLNGHTVRHTVSSLVMLSFAGARPAGLCVLHTDGDNKNNKLQNLRYGTHKENSADARRHGTLMLGERHWGTRLTVDDILLIRRSADTGVCLAAMYGVTPAAISLIRTRKNWASV